ncbi:hypothetical protein [Sphingomonas montanisoli]|uniref:DUF2029 domain-containing protein n=1 Tax=Sphingomonas montanisoli TaxID=2606412 RepID=A0A5D9C9V1_9SPHN|nr:hypothetical protein [Sphingomonas montanisoli]TZG27830.1 hypothetical protein FYJ91_09745 [Sphingomonas montanisoli]
MTAKERALHWLLLAVLILLAAEQFADALIEHRHAPMLDLAVYRSAAENGPLIRSPHGPMYFTYHPIMRHFFEALGAQFDLKLLTVYTLLTLLYGATIHTRPGAALATFLGLAIGGLGVAAITTGNITPFVQLAILGLAARGFDAPRDRWTFLAAVAVTAIVKPYMIAYAILPLGVAMGRRQPLRPHMIAAAATIGAVVALIALYAVVRPDETATFIRNLTTQTLAQGDLGIGSYGRLAGQLGSAGALIAHGLIVLTAAAIAIGSAWRQGRLADPAFALLLFFLAAILNPRLQDYDLFPAIVALTLYILSTGGWRATAALLPAFIAAAIPLHGARFVDIESGFWPYAPNVYAVATALLVLGLLTLPRSPRSPSARP